MNTSLFLEIVSKYFKAVVGKITEKFNGSKEEKPMLHKTMLTEEYSADLTWGSTELQHSIVAADVVSLDSSLPLKSRGSFANATGKLPKLGIKFRKGEKDISDINVMRARGTDEATVVAKIFDDVTKCVKSMDVRKEIMFEQGLSTGVTLVTDDQNTGTGIRVSFGYKPENTFHCKTAAWGETGYNPIDDLEQMFDKASEDSNTIGMVLISKEYFNLIRSSVYGKKLVADYRGQVYTSTDLLPQPGREAMIEALNDEFSTTFRIVDSTYRVENRDGSFTSIKPWATANIVGVPSENVGRLVYGTLAEETNPVQGVSYQKSGSHVLISKFSKTDPLEEYTAAQAICLPVIDGADAIYVLHADGTSTVSTDVSSLSFAKGANTTGKKVTVHSDSAWTAAVPVEATWVTLVTSGSTVTVKVSANSETSAPERSTTLTITNAESDTATVTITQAANV